MLKGIIFDLDGTIVDSALDFEAMRAELGLPPKTPLLEALDAMPPVDRERAEAVLLRHELAAAKSSVLIPGVDAILNWLDANQLKRALFSRNTHEAVRLIVNRLGLKFDPVICREHAPFKPDPRGIWQICDYWGCRREEVLMLGDYLYDVQAGRNAGVRTALITHGKTWDFAQDADFVLSDFAELPALLQPHLQFETR